MDKLYVAPSTDPIKSIIGIIKYAKQVEDFADFLHCDIMDGKFVPNKTYSYVALKDIKSNTLLPIDAHLMIEKPTKFIDKFIKAGANIITVHYECYKNKKQLIKDLQYIHNSGKLSGLSIKPLTNVTEILDLLAYCDLVLVMSVEPGKSGQKFLENAYGKVSALKKIKDDNNAHFKIEVDGGVNPEIAQKLKALGANIVVSGNYVFQNESRENAINLLR